MYYIFIYADFPRNAIVELLHILYILYVYIMTYSKHLSVFNGVYFEKKRKRAFCLIAPPK